MSTSTEVGFLGSKVPAYIKNLELDATTKALVGTGGNSRRISIEGGVFRMIVNGEEMAVSEERNMNIVVVAAAPSINRQYYEGTYVKGKAIPPTCWSVDGKTPSKESEKPQHATCDTCPQNIAGSGQGESRACRFQQRLAVVLEGEIDGPVYQLALPATSLFGKGEANNTKLPLQAYARYLAQNGTPITAVVTEMKFDTNAATPKLTFKAVRHLSEEEYGTVQGQGASPDAVQAITLNVFKQDQKGKVKEQVAEEAPAPTAKKPFGKATAKAAAPVVEEAEEETPPAVAPKKAAPVVTGKRPVADVLAEWDD